MKISVCNITNLEAGDESFYLDMMLESALQFVDEIICVLDYPNKKNLTLQDNIKILIVDNFIEKHPDKRIKFFKLNYDENFKVARQFANAKATGDWVFYLDADEVLHENFTSKIRKRFEEYEKNNVDCVHCQYIHFINNFDRIDNSEAIHYGLHRIFKNYKSIKWANDQHSLPDYKWKQIVFDIRVIIWHMGYLRGMKKIHERFERNYRIGTVIHPPYYQVMWRDWHYYGDYPTKHLDRELLPKIIKDRFMMEVYDK